MLRSGGIGRITISGSLSVIFKRFVDLQLGYYGVALSPPPLANVVIIVERMRWLVSVSIRPSGNAGFPLGHREGRQKTSPAQRCCEEDPHCSPMLSDALNEQ